jgi:hypothetical protein
MPFTLPILGRAHEPSRLNVNVFYINFYYAVKSAFCAFDNFSNAFGAMPKTWRGVPAAA